LKEGWKKT